jgi:hypothetical protein
MLIVAFWVFMLIVIMLKVVMQSVVVMLIVALMNIYAYCYHAESRNAECH